MRLENLDDGSKLEAAWTDTLKSALSYFRALLASSASSAWRPVQVMPLTASTVAHDTGQSRPLGSSLGRITAKEVAVHRRSGKAGEVYRAVVEVECGSDVSVDAFRGCLVTPQTRPQWDRMVEEAEVLDLLDAHTRVTKTNYRLGWPSNPRDVVTLSKTLVDQHTIIDISTSLPRTKHEPAYLRPSPPYVRADISLLAWCIQLGGASDVPQGKARITCFWSWNPKGTWAVGGGVPQHMPSMIVGLVDFVRDGSEKVPVLQSYGRDVAIGSVDYDTSRVTLSVGYAVISAGESEGNRRQIEFGLSSTQSWDVRIHVKTQLGEDSPSTSWTPFVGRAPGVDLGAPHPKRLMLRFVHPALEKDEELVRVKISIERTSGSESPGVRINGVPVTIESMGHRPNGRPLLEETASAASLKTISTKDSQMSQDDGSITKPDSKARSAKQEKSIASLVRRNYIYFTSLLQEPEAKWRPILDSRGVAIHQLDSIDKTLVVFRAEAVLVGVSIWDLYATIASPGGRVVWDKTHESAALLEDVNELTDLWHFRSKAAWPVAARDSILLRTTYKSPSSVHIFGFSVDNTDLFPSIPPSIDPNVIRTQIDLQGWSIESLSPNTTQVTLLEQSDPRGWSNKSSIPQVMMATLAGIGDFSIKHGAPPIATRLGGARAVSTRYDVEKGSYRFEYEIANSRRSGSSSTATAFPLPVAVKEDDGESVKSLGMPTKLMSNVECEIRCDAETWASNFIVLVDPPQLAISVLKRHRLSPHGGGLWLTIEHDRKLLGGEKVVVTVRRGPPSSGSKTMVTVNGHRVKVDTEEMNEAEVNLLKKQKRSKPTRTPLDHPPALGTLRKKQSQLELSTPNSSRVTSPNSTYSRITTPLTKMYSYASETTRSAVLPMSTPSPVPNSNDTPVDAAIRALGQLQRIHADRDGESTDPYSWQAVSEKDGLRVEKRVVPHVSETFSVYRAGRIIEGYTAEEISSAISVYGKDERFDRAELLQSYGNGINVSHAVAYTTFPFRQRSVLTSSVIARLPDGPPPSPTTDRHATLTTILHASTSSFDLATLDVDSRKFNPTSLPSAHILLEGWILETIDPYSHEQYAIPSTRCMYVACVDYSGNLPLSVNNMLNSSLPRVILSVEHMLSTTGAPSRSRSPTMYIIPPDATSTGPWAVESATDKIGVSQSNDSSGYSSIIILQPTTRQEDGILSPILHHADSRLSVHTLRSSVVDLGEEIRRQKRDLVIAEIEVGTSFIKSGCDIEVHGVSLPHAQNVLGGPDTTLPLTLPPEFLDLPFAVCIIALAPSLLQSASLEPGSQVRHLLRITLPTSVHEPTINDPLSSRTPPLPRPRWLLDLINDGAVVQVRLKPGASGNGYRYATQQVHVIEEKTSGLLVRDSRNRTPRLVNKSTPDSMSMERPLAVSQRYMTEIIPALPANETDKASTVASLDGAAAPERIAKEPSLEQIVRPSPLPNSRRLSFWKYSRFRGLSSASVPTTAVSSPAKATTSIETSPTPEVQDPIEILFRPVVSYPALILACLVCLLLGSLIRSLLSDSDFVFHPSNSGIVEGEVRRELRRVFQWKLGFNRDLIVAVARRGQG